YRVAKAESAPCGTRTVDLVCVAAALHWFNIEKFYNEVRRVAKRGGVIAVTGYSHHRVNEAVDKVLDRFQDRVNSFWPPERTILEEGYQTIPFQFRELSPPKFPLSVMWNCAEHLGYLRTWSAVKEYVAKNSVDPVTEFEGAFEKAWGDPCERKAITWRLHL